ncbi:MAG: hypothetical protein HZC42_10335 [Candidatus Eisenbacteria bacterium]|nr:hypothetical protein [Candidatus Eisenbacteria bacterium]
MPEFLATVMTRAFDLLMSPFAGNRAVALSVISLLFGVVAMWIFKATSDQARVRRTRDVFVAHILEMRLYRDDLAVLLKAFAAALWSSIGHLGVNLKPLLALLPLILVVVVQLDARFSHAPLGVSGATLVTVALGEGEDATNVPVSLVPGDGIVLDAPPVRAPASGEISWRIRALGAGRHTLALRAGPTSYDFELATRSGTGVIGDRRGDSSLDPLVHPGLPRLDPDGPIARVALRYPKARYPLLAWQGDWLAVFILWSLAGGLAAKFLWRVEI